MNDIVRLACIFLSALNMDMRAGLSPNPKQIKGFMHADMSQTHKVWAVGLILSTKALVPWTPRGRHKAGGGGKAKKQKKNGIPLFRGAGFFFFFLAWPPAYPFILLPEPFIYSFIHF